MNGCCFVVVECVDVLYYIFLGDWVKLAHSGGQGFFSAINILFNKKSEA